jgi:hypothetical protein
LSQIDEEGWYTDPYGLHDARWMSMGEPTKLVRDGDVESYQDPPDSLPSHPAIKIEPPPESVTPADTLRVGGQDPDKMPTISEIDEREREVVESRWTAPFMRFRRKSKSDHRHFQ